MSSPPSSPHSTGPSLDVLIWNILLAAGWTLLASAYLAASASRRSADRDAVERYFLVNSGAFFVGWMWFVVAQDVITVFGIFFRAACGPLGLSVGLTQLIAMMIGAPAVTAGALWLQLALEQRTGAASGGPAARAAQEKAEMRAEKQERKATKMVGGHGGGADMI